MPRTRPAKGRLILPREVRDRHGRPPGVELGVADRGDGERRLAGDRPETTLDELIGCAGYRGPAHTPDEMEAAIARGARTAAGRGRKTR